jgi:very-short-patch-repair endonuclease
MANVRLHNRSDLLGTRRALRHTLTTPEARLWVHLQRRQLDGWKFRRQHSIDRYIVDFYCPAARLAVEIDGTAHDSVAANVYDDRRSEFLASSGVRVIRFMNDDVIRNLQGVLESIRMELRKP